jgi:hypothetical protein
MTAKSSRIQLQFKAQPSELTLPSQQEWSEAIISEKAEALS